MDPGGSLRREGASPSGWRAVQRMQQASMHRGELLTLLLKAVLRGLCAAQLVGVPARGGQKRQRHLWRRGTSSATFVKPTDTEYQPQPQPCTRCISWLCEHVPLGEGCCLAVPARLQPPATNLASAIPTPQSPSSLCRLNAMAPEVAYQLLDGGSAQFLAALVDWRWQQRPHQCRQTSSNEAVPRRDNQPRQSNAAADARRICCSNSATSPVPHLLHIHPAYRSKRSLHLWRRTSSYAAVPQHNTQPRPSVAPDARRTCCSSCQSCCVVYG